jgi:3D (Asp-Asp-Asp) domain-containing protein
VTAALMVRATAYNSLPEQTNSDPFTTARGTLARWGVIAVSRDLLVDALPYGTLVRIRDLGPAAGGLGAGEHDGLLEGIFVVEDTMHPRKQNQIDLWFESKHDALRWGVREVEVEIVKPGRATTAWAR